MKRLFSVLLVVLFLAGLTVSAQAAPTAKNDGKQLSQKATGSLKVQGEVVSLANQYLAYRKKLAQVARAFEAMHNIANYDGTSAGAGGPPGAYTQEEQRLPVIMNQLETLRIILSGQKDNGTGGSEYWMRTELLLARQGKAAAKVLYDMIQNDGTAMHPFLRAALKNVADNLQAAMCKYDNGSGNSDYWCAASGFVRDSMHQSALNISEVLRATTCPPPQNPNAVITATSWLLESFLLAQSHQGNGNSDFWCRTYTILATQANLTATGIENTLRGLPNLMPLIRTSLQNVASNLRQAADRYSNSTGGSDFWMNASGGLIETMNAAGRNLRDLRNSI